MNIVMCFPSDNQHYLDTTVSFIAVWDARQKNLSFYPIDLSDSDKVDFPEITSPCLVYNKKLFDRFYNIESYDLDTHIWSLTNKVLEDFIDLTLFSTYKKMYYHIQKNYYRYIPIGKFRQVCKNIINYTQSISLELNKVSTFYTQKVYPCIYEMEKNGLKVDLEKFNKYYEKNIEQDIIKTNFYLHNTTGRFSNKFDNVNFLALNKSDGNREVFISRFDSGLLLEYDFDSYHLRLISNLVKYPFPEDKSVHIYLSEKYYNIPINTREDYEKAKSISFKALYGYDEDSYIHIPFFEKVYQLRERLWTSFQEKGYVQTPITNRKLSAENLKDINKSKLFNYFLQMTETEFSIIFIYEVCNILKNKLSKIVLYTYDSILIDFNKKDGKELIEEIKKIIITSKLKIGKNYQDMKEVSFVNEKLTV